MTLGLSASAFGKSYTFPAGDGDLADLATWQKCYPDLTALPGAGDTVYLGSDSTFTMSSDMAVGGFSFNSKNAILDFASSGNHTLKVLDTQHAFCAHNGTIKGGTIDRNGKDFFWFQQGGCETTVTDGCVLTNVNSFYVNVWGKSNGKLHLTGGSRIHTSSLTVNDGLADTVCVGTLLEVTGGAKLFTTADWNFSDSKSMEDDSGANVLDVNGSGSAVVMNKYYVNGYHTHGNVLRVSNGGSFTSKGLHVGFLENGHYSNGNRLIVDGGTVSVTGDTLTCRGDGNVIAVTNGVVDFKNQTYGFNASDSTNTKIDIVNSIWKSSGLKMGKKAVLHISGAQTEFNMNDAFFGLGGGHAVDRTVCLDDGFSWCPNIGWGYYLMENTTNCTLAVQNKATLSAWHPKNNDYDVVPLCGAGAADYGASNVVQAIDGGTIMGSTVRLNGRDNTLVVSNGVLKGFSSIDIGPSSWCSNNTVVVQGDNPCLVTTNVVYLRNHSTFRFEIPVGGYVEGCVPFSANAAYFESSCKLEVDVSRFQPENRTELKLMSFGTDLNTDNQNFLLSAELPPRYSLKIVNKRDLVLTAKGEPKGLMLILR